jgi:hypothetical protein
MCNLKSFSNNILHSKRCAFLLLIFALATTAFMPMPPKVIHASGGNPLESTLLAAALPGAFNKSNPTDGAVNQPTNPTLKWGTSLTAKSYQYCIDTTNDNTCASWKSAGTKTSIKLSALTPGVTYYWQVRAMNATGTTYADDSDTAWWSFSIALPPGDFTKSGPAVGAADQPDSVTLSWSPSSNVTDYQYCIDSKNNNFCDTSWISTAGATSIATSLLKPATTYYWQVRAVNGTYPTYADGSTTWWHFAVSALPGSFRKTSPVNGATNKSPNLTLKWGTSLTAKSYQYCVDTTNDNTCTSWKSAGTRTSITLSALTPGVTYYWQVAATNATGTTYANGSDAAWWSFSIIPLPSDFNKSGPTDGTTNLPSNPTLSWSLSSAASSYVYCIDTSNNNTCNSSWISTSANTSITLRSLNPGTKYYWQVRAKNAAGATYADSSNPTWWSFRIAPLPGSFDKTKPVSGATNKPLNLTLKWGTSTNATEYQYCIDNFNDDRCNGLWISTGTATTIVLDSLDPVTTYYWQVRAKSPTGYTYANSGSWWYFITSQLPGTFNKSNPADAATNQLTNVTLSWSTSTNATDYQYCIDTNDNDSCDASWISTGGATSILVKSLTPATTYYWQVLATCGGNKIYADDSATSWRSFTVGLLPGSFSKTSPANGVVNLSNTRDLTPGNPSQSGYSIGVTLEWTASESAASYQYCIDSTDNNTCNASWISVGTNTSVMLNSLQPGISYYWQVRAKNDIGLTYADGSQTVWWSFSTSPN